MDVLEDSKVLYTADGVPILGGTFSVDKKGTPPPGVASLQRLIFNLRVPNMIQRLLIADLYEMPIGIHFEIIELEDGEILVVYGEDVSCAFYLYALPRCWLPYLGVSTPWNPERCL